MSRHGTQAGTPTPSDGSTFDTLGDGILEAIRAGVSVRDAALAAGCSSRTVERWLTKGRDAPDGTYGRFAGEVDAIRRRRHPLGSLVAGAGEMSEYELAVVVSELVRAGNVQAMRLYWQMLCDGFDPAEGTEPPRPNRAAA